MTLPGGLQMFVAEACSGMRQLTGFLALTTAVAYLSTRPVWYRIVIIISALPIALSANIARVMLTGYIMHFVNPQFALGTYHTLEGLLMMGFGLLLLHCECVILDQHLSDARSQPRTPAAIPTRRRRGRWRSALLESPVGRMTPSSPVNERSSTARRNDVTTITHAALRRDPLDRPGGPGGPGTAQPHRPPAACGDPWPRFRWSSATGSARTSRSIPTSSIVPRRPNTSVGPTRAASSPGFASASGSTFRSREPICATARRSASLPEAGPRSNR